MISRIKSSRRASAIAVALLIVLVAAAAWVGVVSPKRSNVTKLKGQVVAAQTQLATATQAAAVANKAAEAAALKAMPADADEPGILDQLNSLGKAHRRAGGDGDPERDVGHTEHGRSVGDGGRNVLPDRQVPEQAPHTGSCR